MTLTTKIIANNDAGKGLAAELPLQTSSDSVQVRALLQLRELILSGELAGGSRITELAVVQRLGASMSPLR